MSTLLRSRWLAWQPKELPEAPMQGTVKRVERRAVGTSVGFEGSVPERVAPIFSGGPLDISDCMVLIGRTFQSLEAEYKSGALSVLDTDYDLRARFDTTEASINDLAKVPGGPTESDFRKALAEHAAVWRELIARYRARQERQADPMPELPEDTALAIGISYGDDQPGRGTL